MTPEQLKEQLDQEAEIVVVQYDRPDFKKYIVCKGLSSMFYKNQRYVKLCIFDIAITANPAFADGWEVGEQSADRYLEANPTMLVPILDAATKAPKTESRQIFTYDPETGQETGTETIQVPRYIDEWTLHVMGLLRPILKPHIENAIKVKMKIDGAQPLEYLEE